MKATEVLKLFSPIDLTYFDENGSTLLHYAINYGLPDLARELIKLNKSLLFYFDCCYGEIPLHIAVKKGYIELAKEILNNEPTLINIRDRFDETVFHKILIAKYKELRAYKKQYNDSVEHFKNEQTYEDAEKLLPIIDLKRKCNELNHKYNEFLASFMSNKVPTLINDNAQAPTEGETQSLTGNSVQNPLLTAALFLQKNSAGMTPLSLAIIEGDIATVSGIIRYIAPYLDSSAILDLLSPYTKSYNMFNPATAKFVKEIYAQIGDYRIEPDKINYSAIEKGIIGLYHISEFGE